MARVEPRALAASGHARQCTRGGAAGDADPGAAADTANAGAAEGKKRSTHAPGKEGPKEGGELLPPRASDAAVMAAAAEGAISTAAGGCFKACGALSRCVTSCCSLFGSWVKHLPAPVVGAILRVFNIANAVLLGTCAWFSYKVVLGDVTKSFLTTYMFIFGCLLLLVRPPSPPRPTGPRPRPFLRRPHSMPF